MEFYDVLERRRTVRDFSHKEVSDALLKKVLAAAFCAPTNDHLHQLEFIVIRDKNRIAEMIAPVAGNTEAIQQTYIAAEGHAMDADELAMFEDALPKQQRMLMQSGCLVLPFFRQRGCPSASRENRAASIISLPPGRRWRIFFWPPRRKGSAARCASPSRERAPM